MPVAARAWISQTESERIERWTFTMLVLVLTWYLTVAKIEISSGVAVGIQTVRQPVRHQSPEEGRHRREGWSGKVNVHDAVTSTSSLSFTTKLIHLIITPRTVITVSYAPPSAPLCLSPVWCVRSGSLRPSTAPTTPSWSTCLHVSRRQNMCVLSWSTPQEETSWCTYMPTSFLSHVLCEFCYVCVVCVCVCVCVKEKKGDVCAFLESSMLCVCLCIR